jgi:hypothetical protein
VPFFTVIECLERYLSKGAFQGVYFKVCLPKGVFQNQSFSFVLQPQDIAK